ncbi:glycosyltransferase family 9 protein [Geovibrio thiophilus]|uniref:Glycosyltransferase family 9 protein n=1 Tax=Geovibrio thiophilus TaxID=139438 RepID=A0A3R5YZ18_9BACT|nr:glycosyltransferase family 9 protein [Geovibrio thiophilus]QAR32963.1 glycosyltransferase family 9 protein [Geovibrio thiophilus]
MNRRPVTVFFKLGALGDTIMTTPALRAYRKSFPHEEIIYIIGKTCEAALLGNPNIDRLITFDDDAFYTGGVVTRMRTMFKVTNLIKSCRAEKIFIMQRDGAWDHAAKNAGITERFGFSDGKSKYLTRALTNWDEFHEVDAYIELCKLAEGFKPDGHVMNVYHSESEPERVASLTGRLFEKRVIAVAPGGRSGMKAEDDLRRWRGYLELIRKIVAESDCNVLVIGSKSDKDLLDTGGFDEARVKNLCGKIPVAGSYAALKRCTVLVANDGGAMILGAAAGIPVVSIFGPTSPLNRYPITNHLSRYIWLEKKCSPCIKNGSFPRRTNHSCMGDITPDMVFAEIKDVLSRIGQK